MKRFINTMAYLVLAGLLFPGPAFGGGSKEKQEPAPKGKEQSGAAPVETNLKDVEVATVQVAPSVPKETIFLGQLKAEVARVERIGNATLTAEDRRKILDVMINEKLATQAASRDKITVSDNEINQYLERAKGEVAAAIGRTPTDIEFAVVVMNQTGIEPPGHLKTDEEKKNYILDNFKTQVRRQAIVQQYLTVKKDALFKSIKMPTESEITAYYNQNKSRFVRPNSIRFNMIQVDYGPDTASKSKAKELAERLVRQIGSDPSQFDEAVVKGQTPNAGYKAGDFGGYLPQTPMAEQNMGADFMRTVFALRQGQVSKMIDGKQGYQIVKVTEILGKKDLALEDIAEPGTRMTVKDYIGNALLQERQQAVLTQAQQELVTELRAGKTFSINENNLKLNW